MKSNVQIFENLLANWVDTSSNLINIEAIIFVKEGKEEIDKKVEDTKGALASQGIRYGLKYEEIERKYNLNENETGNLLGDYKSNLLSLNNIYKKVYKSVINAKVETTKELKKILLTMNKLINDREILKEKFKDYREYEIKIVKLAEEAKRAIECGKQKEALELSAKIAELRDSNPLKEYNNRINLFTNQIEIYNEIISDCEEKMSDYYEERRDKFDKAIIIEPIEENALTIKKRKWEFWNK